MSVWREREWPQERQCCPGPGAAAGGQGARRIHCRNLIPAPNWTPSQILENKVLSLKTGSQRSRSALLTPAAVGSRDVHGSNTGPQPCLSEARALLAARPHPLALAAPSSAFGGRARRQSREPDPFPASSSPVSPVLTNWRQEDLGAKQSPTTKLWWGGGGGGESFVCF